MSRLAQANLRLLLPNEVVSPTPSPYCRYLPCARTTDVAAGWIISSVLQSCTSTIAVNDAWQTISDGSFRDNCTPLKGESSPLRFSPPAALFQYSSSLFCLTGSDRPAMQPSLLFKSEGKSEDQDPPSGAPFVHTPSAQQRSKCQNKNPYNSRYLYWTRNSGGTKISQFFLQKLSLLQGLLNSLAVSQGVGETTYTDPNKSYSR